MLQRGIEVRDGASVVEGSCAYIASIVVQITEHFESYQLKIRVSFFIKFHDCCGVS